VEIYKIKGGEKKMANFTQAEKDFLDDLMAQEEEEEEE
jgi:hypothetical protein